LNRGSKVFEKEIYELWKKRDSLIGLNSVSGENIAVIDPGVQNNDIAGPDFKNARIRIGNLTFVGDIEIDPNYVDWKSHGHNIDSKYNKVILHVALYNNNNQPYVYTKDGRKVPTVTLSEFLPKNIHEILPADEEEEESGQQHLKCGSASASVPKDDKLKFISKLGVERFNKKCGKIYGRLKELKYLDELHAREPVITYDLTPAFQERVFVHSDFRNKELWEQLFYELIFEALGYSKNKGIMLNLAQHANIGFLKTIENEGNFIENAESALLNIGGLIPEEKKMKDAKVVEYSNMIKTDWERIRTRYDSKFFDETQWHFFRIRPQNFPTIRIAGGARLLKKLLKENLIPVIIRKIEEIHNLNVLINSLRSIFVIKSEGFWRYHYVFDQPANGEIKYFIGSSRADEILINVVLPFFSVYFDIFGKKDLSKKVFTLYNRFSQTSENKIVHEIATCLELDDKMHSTVYSQGMTELFRNYCSKGKCLECEIGKVVFN
jgi:hypothetical protein